MSGVQVDNSPAAATRSRDISSWKEEDISTLSSSEKKRYYRRKSAIKAYFTTEEPLDQIALRYHFPTKMVEKLARRCLMQHEDSAPWGFRALMPGAKVVDHTPTPELIAAEKTEAKDEEVPAREDRQALFADVENALNEVPPSDHDDNEDTAQRRAIVLPQENPPTPDDMPDIVGIEKPGTGNGVDRVEDNSDKDDEEPTIVDALETQPAERAEVDAVNEGEEPTVDGTEEITIENEAQAALELENAAEAAVIDTEIEVVSPDDQPEQEPEKQVETIGDEDAQVQAAVFYMPELPRKPSRSLVVRGQMLPAALVIVGKKRSSVTGKKPVMAQRSIRRRWVRSVERARKRSVHRMISAVVVAIIFLSLLIPVGAGIAAYSAYTSIKSIAMDGVNHLMNVKTLLPVSKSDPTAVLNLKNLQQANVEFTQAQGDFLQLQQLVDRQDVQSLIQQFAPQYSSKLGMAQNLLQVGIDVTRMGSELMNVAMLGANILHGSPLASGSTKPLITVNDISNIEGTMLHALYYIQDIKAQMSQVVLNQLPISLSQQKLITSAMALLPKAQSYIEQGQGVIGILSWLLGVGQARRFLIQTMDSAELRPSGGFTGQYGVLDISNGRISPFSLQDVTELDYNGNGAELGRQAPPEYRSWMNFGFFGLRDSNLSGDFPTSARLAMQVFQEEGGGPVDGDIMFTPTVIEHVLDIIGPIKVPEYNEIITAQNLEDKLHYYQNNPAAIALQKQKTGTNNAASRKSFTSLVGRIMLDTVRHLPVKTLMKVVQNATKDIQSRDLEIYFNNPQVEGWLVQHSFSGAMDTFSKVDGFMVVQANISISKASQYVQTAEQDNIYLDPQGGATHNLTITLTYNQTGPVYGYDTYADYIRVYAPANAVFEGGDGFDTGKALCTPGNSGTTTGTGGPVKPPPPPPPPPGKGTPPLPGCEQYAKSFPSNARYCPSGNYSLGQNAWVPGKGFTNWPIDGLGAPTQLTSDLPGRAMWGGLTVTPKNCNSYITLSWYVPNVVKHVPGQPLYSVLVQKQGGYIPTVEISIDTSALNGVKPYNFQSDIFGDRLFSLAVVKKK